MTPFLILVAWNFAVATVLALLVALLCLAPAVARRPALRHALWLLVLVKLITPPLAPVPILPATDNSSNTSAADVDPFPASETAANHQSRDADSNPSELAVVPAAALEPASPPAGIAPTVEPRPVRERPPTALPTSSGEPGVKRANAPVFVWWRTPMTLLAVSLLGTLVLLWRGWRRMSRLSRMLHRAGTSDRLRRIVRDAAAAMRMAEAPAVSVVEAHLSPLLWVGRRGPIVVLPAKLVDELNDEQLLDVVRHEIAHYLRRDHWSNGLAFLITALWWWNPVAWWTRNRLRAAQELCCDAMVIDGSASTRRRYAETLLKVLDFLQSEKPVLPAVGTGFGGSGPVRRRFEMIADADLSHRWSRRSILVVLCAAALLPWLPTTRAQEHPDDARAIDPGEAAPVHHHHDPSQHAAMGDAAFVRQIIGRYDPDFWQSEEEIADLYRAGLAVLSPERDWLALVRDGELVVIEVRYGHVAQREQLGKAAEQIEWLPGGVRVAMADGGERRFDVTPQVIRLLDARGRVEIVNSVVTAEVGYSDRLPAWSTWPTPDGGISLAGLPAGEHWLVTTPVYLDVLRVKVPQDEPLIERRQRAPTTNRSTDVNGRLSVRWDEEAGDILRIEIENRTGDVIRFSEQDVKLEAGTRRFSSHYVLSPWWVSDQSEPAREIAIEDGQTGAMEIHWRHWVRGGLWVSRYGDPLAEPSLPEPEPGRMFVRLRGPYFGSLPVDVAHPMNERNAPLQGTWRLTSTETVGVEIASEAVPYDPAVSEQPHMRMVINRQMISGMPVVPAETPFRIHPSGTGMLTDPEVHGMYSLNDTASPKTLAVERHRQTGTRIETEFRTCLYRFLHYEGTTASADPVERRVLELAFNPENPDKPPSSWDRGPLAIFRFEESQSAPNADDRIDDEDPPETSDTSELPRPEVPDAGEQPQILRILDADGEWKSFNSVVPARIGYRGTAAGRFGWGHPPRDRTVSLAGFPPGEHWLVVMPWLDAVRVEMPLSEPAVEHRMRAESILGPDGFGCTAAVHRDEDAGDIIRIEIENIAEDAMQFSERDVCLDVFERQGQIEGVLSPRWTLEDPDTVPVIAVNPGQTGQIDINWREWVRDGLWISPLGYSYNGPVPLKSPGAGKIWVRANVRNHGPLPVAVADPEMPEHVESAEIRLQGALVTPEAIAELAGREWDSVSLIDAEFNGAIIERLRHADAIRALQLTGEGLSGQVSRLEHVSGLVALEIGAPLRVQDLQAIGDLTQLERLTLPQELALTVTGARQIARLTKLKSLGLYNVDVDDASFAELATLINLEELDLSHTRITDDGLQVLVWMPHLKSLELRRHPEWHIPQQISDAGVPVICQLTELERLSLSGDLTDDGLMRIAELPQLKDLSILNTRITGDGLAALKDSNVESLTVGVGLIGVPVGQTDEQILRSMPGLDNIRKCRNLKSVRVIGESSPDYNYEALQRLAPNVDWAFSG